MKILTRWIVGATALITSMLLLASPGVAQSSCYGTTCDGLDPAATTCANDAYTIQSTEAVVESGNWGHLELRYSPSCHSNWVRFTPWHGVQAWLGNLAAGAEVSGSPWIWRLDVADSLRGTIGQSSPVGSGVTKWTAMVTADGTTCSSVEVYEAEFTEFGGGDNRSLGTYDAPCLS
jgi:hypothetical protein